MNSYLATAGGGLSWFVNSRETIDLVGKLWDIECRHFLGKLTRAEYRRSRTANSRRKFDDGCLYRRA